MSWDIYGNNLTAGHCEVHPDIPEPYPCAECRQPEQVRTDDPCEGCFYVTGRMQLCDNSCNGFPGEAS